MTETPPLVIIAGAGQGTGRTLALMAVRAGYSVAGFSRTKSHLETLEIELGSEAPRFTGIAVDLQDEAACKAMVDRAVAKYGPVRGLVNCAATWTGGRQVIEAKASDFKQSFEMNFYTAFNVIAPVLAHWDGRGRSGDLAIVSLGATASLRGGKRSALYATAKGSLRTLSQSLAKELGPAGVHVSHVVIDGMIDNPRTRAMNPQMAAERFLSPVAIARTVLQLIEQSRDCWTFECDLRPLTEPW